MAVGSPRPEAASADLIESSYLTYIIPLATNLSLEELFQDVEDSKSVFDSVERRTSLFFGTLDQTPSM